MTLKNSKTNVSLQFLNARLDQVQMSEVERLKAKAQLARTEAAVDVIFAIGHGAKLLLKKHVLRPFRRMAASFG